VTPVADVADVELAEIAIMAAATIPAALLSMKDTSYR
jgi:hypothetical protein